ncbi:1395_t:CDS:2 [Entrophospora sp. SA101]|nr:1395_t:CDS:2 [Entrophospora sp. SA101]
MYYTTRLQISSLTNTVIYFGWTGAISLMFLVLTGHNDDGYKDDDEQYDSSKEFGWDNESSRKEVGIESFKIHSRPVTNGEYLKFIRATHIKHAEWKGMRLLSEEELSALYAIHKSSPPINIKHQYQGIVLIEVIEEDIDVIHHGRTNHTINAEDIDTHC